jgi:hypothetical protein
MAVKNRCERERKIEKNSQILRSRDICSVIKETFASYLSKKFLFSSVEKYLPPTAIELKSMPTWIQNDNFTRKFRVQKN